MDIVAQFTPNNEVRISLQSLKSPRKRLTDCLPVQEAEKIARHALRSQVEIVTGMSRSVILRNGNTPNNIIVTHEDAELARKAQTRSLDILRDFQTHNEDKRNARKTAKKSGYGFGTRRTKFSRFARRKIISGGALLERDSKAPAQAVLVTCTLPGSGSRAMSALSRWSGYIVNRCLTRVRVAFKRHWACEGIRLRWFYCWEFQRRGALHLHLCLWTDRSQVSLQLGELFREGWKEAILAIGNESEPHLCETSDRKSCWLPQYWQNDVSPVRESVARYVSKYVSKDGSNAETLPGNGKAYYPARWWGMDRFLGKSIRRESAKLKVCSLSESEATAIAIEVERELINLGVVQMYHWAQDIGSASYHVGYVSCSGYYVAEGMYEVVREWLPELILRFTSRLHRSRYEYENVSSELVDSTRMK